MVSPMTLQYESNPKDPFEEKRKIKLSCPDIMQIKCTYTYKQMFIYSSKRKKKEKKKKKGHQQLLPNSSVHSNSSINPKASCFYVTSHKSHKQTAKTISRQSTLVMTRLCIN